MGLGLILPRLLKLWPSETSGLTYCIHEDGGISVHFKLRHADTELVSTEDLEYSVTQCFKDLSSDIKIRFRSLMPDFHDLCHSIS
jgi:hypothetical protein